MIVQFVDANRAEFGVEPVCCALQVAPSTYWTAKRRPPSARALRDARMMPVLLALWQANYSVYGARKLWVAARRAGHDIGRDQVARLMKQLGIRGVKRAKKVRTTRADPAAERPADLVERDFTAEGPNQLWVADLTHVATWSGVAYACFITDAFSRRIVGLAGSVEHAHPDGPRRARNGPLEPRRTPGRTRRARRRRQPVHQHPLRRAARRHRRRPVSRVGRRLLRQRARESVNGLFKTELIRGPSQGPWRTVDDVELATLGWVHWWNTHRIHGYLDDLSPDQFETAYAAAKTDHDRTENQNNQPAQNPG